jgi:tetraacyldisaccharide 4'-kinase
LASCFVISREKLRSPSLYATNLMKSFTSFLRLCLYPISLLWGLGALLHRFWYQSGLGKIYKPPIETICIGNLTVGGTGKTPHTLHFARQKQQEGHKVGILLRGYKRHTRGYLQVQASHQVEDVGDEALFYYQKVGEQMPIAVAEKRAQGIEKLIADYPHLTCLILDDAFQHHAVEAQTYYLLSDYHRPFYQDYLLPMGNLRENRQQAQRCHYLIITKCPPDLSKDHKEAIAQAARPYCSAPILFSALTYRDFEPLVEKKRIWNENTAKVIVVSGLANPTPLRNYLRQQFEIAHELNLPDHYHYAVSDLQQLAALATQHQCPIITTEKDATKLAPLLRQTPALRGLDIWQLPIDVRFL